MKFVRLTAVSALLLGACSSSSSGGGDGMKEKASMAASQPAGMAKNIVAVAKDAKAFNTLVTALNAAGLTETLSSGGPFTVFAPTDEAFAALPAGTLQSLLKPENKAQLQNVLKYHVVSGQVMAEEVVGLSSAESLLGASLPIQTEGGQVMVGNATVVQTDVEASNGVIHVIDQVLLPPQ